MRVVKFKAFGEKKTIKGWLNDPRCKIKAYSTLHNRIKLYGSVEKALVTPLNEGIQFKAFGEKKPIKDWLKDPRCKVESHSTLHNRIKRYGWSVERSLVTPVKKESERERNEKPTFFKKVVGLMMDGLFTAQELALIYGGSNEDYAFD